MQDFIPCRRCKGNGKTVPVGFYKDSETRNGIEYKILKECLHHKAWRLQKEVFDSFIQNGLDEKLFDLNMNGDYEGIKSKNNIIRLNTYIEKYYENEDVRASILYFYGPPDTQKTAVAAWITKSLLNKFTVKYVKFIKFFEEFIFDLWNGDENTIKNDNVNQYENCDLLIIDDFSDDFSEKQSSLLEKFLLKRIISKKGFIIISKKPIKSIKCKNIKDLLEKETKKRQSEFAFEDVINDIPDVLF